jgi:uncharacterized damage-inducible protein DinB
LSATEFETVQARHTRFFVQQLDGDLERVVPFQRLTGERYRSTAADILLHLCTHAAHHRGQMAAYASGRDIAAPRVDFISYCIEMGL